MSYYFILALLSRLPLSASDVSGKKSQDPFTYPSRVAGLSLLLANGVPKRACLLPISFGPEKNSTTFEINELQIHKPSIHVLITGSEAVLEPLTRYSIDLFSSGKHTPNRDKMTYKSNLVPFLIREKKKPKNKDQ